MAMVQVESYNFATVENPLSDGGNFTIVSDANFSGLLKAISGNLCEPTTAATAGGAFWSGSIPAPSNNWPADHYSEITLTTAIGASFTYLLVRQGTATSGTQYLLTLAYAGSYTLYAIVAGTVHTLVATTGTTVAQGDVWRLSIAGNVLTWSRNGTVVSSFTDTNNYITSGSPGFGLYSVTGLTDSQTALWAAGANQAATPTLSPNGGSFGPAQTVTITSSTSGGTIYYTLDGSTPTHSSSSISNGGTISVSSSATVKAIASVTNFVDSAVGSASFTINGAVTTSTFAPAGGNYATSQSVTVSNADSALSGFAQYYTTDGSTPTTGSTPVSGPITVSSSLTLKVLAVATNYSNSAIASAAYVIGGGGAVGWSPVDSRQAVPGFGPGANTGIVDEQGNVIYSAQKPPFTGNSQVSDNSAIPPVDSRTVGAPVDSRVSIPENSRVAPPFGGVGEP